MPLNRYCYFHHAYPLAHFLNNPLQGCWCQKKGKTLCSNDGWKAVPLLIKTQHCLTRIFWKGRGASSLEVGMFLCEQVLRNLKSTWQSCWQCYLVLSNSVHCLKHGCRLMFFSLIHFLKLPYCYYPTTFHEFGITIPSLTPDKEPNKSELLSVSSQLIFRFLVICSLTYI